MIPRYSRPEMAAIWTEHAKLQRWLEVELAVCRAWCRRGVIPADDLAQIEAKAAFSVERTLEIEKTTNHDVVAFLTNVNENIGPASRWVHYGMTSSDVLDTGLALAMVQSGTLLVAAQAELTQALKARALEHRDTLCVGRTHGVHAEPTTFGLRLAGFALESRRNEERLKRAHEQIAYGKLSGAVGTYAMLDPAEEAFGKGQKGSSAMPHKRNPITAERITGLARVIRSNSIAALEDVALWHERDISHSSVERVILPDSYTLLDYLLATSTKLIEGLLVRPDRMKQVLDSSYGLVYSQRVLLGLVEEGLTREEAYAAVQRNAMVAWDTGTPLRELLGDDDDVTGKISPERLDSLFDPSHHLRHMDDLMARVEAL